MSDQFLTSPTNHITAIASDDEVAVAARSQIEGAALQGVSVTLLEPEDSDEVTLDPDDATDSVLARIRKLFGDETPHLEHLATALEKGAQVVCVGLPDPDQLDDEQHEELKHRIADLLVEVGATDATFHGRWGIEELTTRR